MTRKPAAELRDLAGEEQYRRQVVAGDTRWSGMLFNLVDGVLIILRARAKLLAPLVGGGGLNRPSLKVVRTTGTGLRGPVIKAGDAVRERLAATELAVIQEAVNAPDDKLKYKAFKQQELKALATQAKVQAEATRALTTARLFSGAPGDGGPRDSARQQQARQARQALKEHDIARVRTDALPEGSGSARAVQCAARCFAVGRCQVGPAPASA